MAKVTILRGLPGSGKSTLAARIARETGAWVVSADDYPGLYTARDDGSVAIDPSKLDPAHGDCFRTALCTVQEYGKSVVVDNTNLSPAEVAPYVAIAQAFRAECEIVLVECDPEVAYGRQTHGVPREAFGRMVKALDPSQDPPHWEFLPWLTLRRVDGQGGPVPQRVMHGECCERECLERGADYCEEGATS